MPITQNREIIPFVNNLEERINELIPRIEDWEKNKQRLLMSITSGQQAQSTAIAALTKVDEAIAEISGATYGIVAERGTRLKTALENLKGDIYKIVEGMDLSGMGSGGGGALTEGEFYEELNNAVSNVDSSVHKGLKLDYLLNNLQDQVTHAIEMRHHYFDIPMKEVFDYNPNKIQIVEKESDQKFLAGEIIVLDSEGNAIKDEYGNFVECLISSGGSISFKTSPDIEEGEELTAYYILNQKLEDMEEDFMRVTLDMVVKKGEAVASDLSSIEEAIDSISDDIEAMKGAYWTPDYSIMKNHIDLSKELITPKGVYIRNDNKKPVLSFSYTDHPALSHFVVETFDEDEQKWIPIDNGNNGVISK